MELSKQCVSLELAKRLKELGVPQDSYFIWKCMSQLQQEWIVDKRDHQYPDEFSAFTSAELADLIPGKLQLERYNDGKWTAVWLSYPMNEYSKSHQEKADTLADAMAKMLIHLIEQKLITL